MVVRERVPDALSVQHSPLYRKACDRSVITFLATGKGEEHGSVEFDFVALDGHDARVRPSRVGIRPKEAFSASRPGFPGGPRGRGLSLAMFPDRPSQAGSSFNALTFDSALDALTT